MLPLLQNTSPEPVSKRSGRAVMVLELHFQGCVLVCFPKAFLLEPRCFKCGFQMGRTLLTGSLLKKIFGFTLDLLSQTLWGGGPGICVLTALPGRSTISKVWEALPWSWGSDSSWEEADKGWGHMVNIWGFRGQEANLRMVGRYLGSKRVNEFSQSGYWQNVKYNRNIWDGFLLYRFTKENGIFG